MNCCIENNDSVICSYTFWINSTDELVDAYGQELKLLDSKLYKDGLKILWVSILDIECLSLFSQLLVC